jgi:tRNA(Arg) A34 adenosine deaminase TadA
MIQPRIEFMKAAIQEAIRAKNEGDYAIGAVVVKGDEIISKGGERIKIDNDPTRHAEVIAISDASKFLNNRFLEDCILYTTHEPCPMCASAAIWARMKGIVFGSNIEDMKEYALSNNNTEWTWRTIDIPASMIIEKGTPKLFLVENFMREECKKLFHS